MSAAEYGQLSIKLAARKLSRGKVYLQIAHKDAVAHHLQSGHEAGQPACMKGTGVSQKYMRAQNCAGLRLHISKELVKQRFSHSCNRRTHFLCSHLRSSLRLPMSYSRTVVSMPASSRPLKPTRAPGMPSTCHRQTAAK